jgi:PIN domain nuclease of toxin-antitoxin system
LNLLLDTHAFVWWLDDNPKLGGAAREAIADPASVVWVSAASVWEIAIKTSLGRLRLARFAEVQLPREIARNGFQPLSISAEHALRAGALPRHHSDPFDRMLIAQAQMERLQIVTADRRFSEYKVLTIVPTR